MHLNERGRYENHKPISNDLDIVARSELSFGRMFAHDSRPTITETEDVGGDELEHL